MADDNQETAPLSWMPHSDYPLEGDDRPAALRAFLAQQEALGSSMAVGGGLLSEIDPISDFYRGFLGIRLGDPVPYLKSKSALLEPRIEDEIVWPAAILLKSWQQLIEWTPLPVKLVLPGALTLASLCVQDKEKNADTFETHVEQFAHALTYELQTLPPRLIAERVGMVQIDEPVLTNDQHALDLLRMGLEALKRLVVPLPPIALAVYFSDCSKVWRQLQELPVEVLVVDLCSDKAMEEVIIKQGSDKPLHLGLVDGLSPKMETLEDLQTKVKAIQSVCGGKSLVLTSSCHLRDLPVAVAEKKHQRLKDVVDSL